MAKKSRMGFGEFEENFPGSDLTDDEWEFLKAIRAYQVAYRRRYPTWREVLAVLRGLGYRKVPPDPPPEHEHH